MFWEGSFWEECCYVTSLASTVTCSRHLQGTLGLRELAGGQLGWQNKWEVTMEPLFTSCDVVRKRPKRGRASSPSVPFPSDQHRSGEGISLLRDPQIKGFCYFKVLGPGEWRTTQGFWMEVPRLGMQICIWESCVEGGQDRVLDSNALQRLQCTNRAPTKVETAAVFGPKRLNMVWKLL